MTQRIVSGRQTRVEVSGQSDIGETRRVAARICTGFNFSEVAAGRIAIVATELATNIVRHAGSGEVLLQMFDDDVTPELEMLSIDKGPGMQDVDACMRDGYSTGGTAGQGLGAISRLSSTFDLHSEPDFGTVVLSRVQAQSLLAKPRGMGSSRKFQIGAINLPVKGEIECGDTWRVAANGSQISVFIADGLGHGPLAAVAAGAAASAYLAQPFAEPAIAMQNMHATTGGTRGAAAACAVLDVDANRLKYAGVGNIAGAVVTEGRSRGMVSHNGTLGVKLLRKQQFEYPFPPGSHIVMHSDGLSARWNLSRYVGLSNRHCAVAAAVLYRDFGRQRDDITVVVARAQT